MFFLYFANVSLGIQPNLGSNSERVITKICVNDGYIDWYVLQMIKIYIYWKLIGSYTYIKKESFTNIYWSNKIFLGTSMHNCFTAIYFYFDWLKLTLKRSISTFFFIQGKAIMDTYLQIMWLRHAYLCT